MDTADARLAVVIVTRNAETALRDSVLSVLALDDPRVTLYVIDGASTDGTVAFLESLPNRPLAWISEPDRGIYDAMNKGWAMVPPDDFVLYLGAGDRILSLPSFAAFDAAARSGQRILIGHCLHGEQSVESRWCDTLYYGNTIHHQALMVRKSVHPEPPFDTSFKAYGDWEFNARLFKRGIPAHHIADFRTYADPGGVSSVIYLAEACRIGFRHGGLPALARAYRRHAPIRLRQIKARLRARIGSR